MDMGTNSAYMDRTKIRQFLGKQKVDYLFLSHPDLDHFNLMDAIHRAKIQDTVTMIYHACSAGHYTSKRKLHDETRKWFSKHVNAGKTKEIEKCVGTARSPIDVCKVSVTICENKKRSRSSNPKVVMRVLASGLGGCPRTGNNRDSLVLQLVTPAGFKVLIPGDFEDRSSTAKGGNQPTDMLINANGQALKSDIYQLAHHGAYGKANKLRLLKAVKPRYVFSSSSAPPGQYGHPRCKVYDDLMTVMPNRNVPTHPFSCGRNRYTATKLSVNIHLYSTIPLYESPSVKYVIHFANDLRTKSVQVERIRL